ncbi:hypothetical protein VKT23_015521 [Stygiomarasmius scandens]|uniref:Uncharacterized protein n=1 Tax=Marasmiellus scandens TaxID=2682957 RepID=A0ABR1J1P8_9AGAR
MTHSAPACWSSAIQSILSSDACDTHTNFHDSTFASRSLRSSRFPAGSIWRSLLTKCIYNDNFPSDHNHKKNVAQNAEGNQSQDSSSVPMVTRTMHQSRQRRFARMDEMGIGALIMYELPNELAKSEGVVFDARSSGAEIEELFETIQANVVYLPLYACSSFVIGQLMNATFYNPNMRPFPAPGGQGFTVESTSFTLFDHGIPNSRNPRPVCDVRRLVRPTKDSARRYREDLQMFSCGRNNFTVPDFSSNSPVPLHTIPNETMTPKPTQSSSDDTAAASVTASSGSLSKVSQSVSTQISSTSSTRSVGSIRSLHSRHSSTYAIPSLSCIPSIPSMSSVVSDMTSATSNHCKVLSSAASTRSVISSLGSTGHNVSIPSSPSSNLGFHKSRSSSDVYTRKAHGHTDSVVRSCLKPKTLILSEPQVCQRAPSRANRRARSFCFSSSFSIYDTSLILEKKLKDNSFEARNLDEHETLELCHDQCTEGDLAVCGIPLDWDDDLAWEAASYLPASASAVSASSSRVFAGIRGSSTSTSLASALSMGFSMLSADAASSSCVLDGISSFGDVSLCTLSTGASFGPLTPTKGEKSSMQPLPVLPSSGTWSSAPSNMNFDHHVTCASTPPRAADKVYTSSCDRACPGLGEESAHVDTQAKKRERRMGRFMELMDSALDLVVVSSSAEDRDEPVEMDLGTDVNLVGLEISDDENDYDVVNAEAKAESGGFGFGFGSSSGSNVDFEASSAYLSCAPTVARSPRLGFPIPVESTSVMFPDLFADLNLQDATTNTADDDFAADDAKVSFSSDAVSVLTSPVQKKALQGTGTASVFRGIDFGFGWTLRKRGNSQSRKGDMKSKKPIPRGKENIPPLRLAF